MSQSCNQFMAIALCLFVNRVLYFDVFLFSVFLAGKEKKSCSPLPRMAQDTCLFPVDEKAVEYYFASDARSVTPPLVL